MKVGVLLPTFRSSADDALEAADRAAVAGLDGVFAFDHLWPMGQPLRPALAPLPVLAAVAARHSTLVVGPLVARVGLFSTDSLVEQLRTLVAIAPGRVVCALGTGDRLSDDEQRAYGLAVRSAEERRALLVAALVALGPTTTRWCGAGSPATNACARSVGAEINLWGAPLDRVSELAREGPVNWAGPLEADVDGHLDALARRGASWAIASAPVDLHALAQWRRRH